MRYDDYKLELDQFQKQEVNAISAALTDLTSFRSLALWGDTYNPTDEDADDLNSKKSPRKRGNSTDMRSQVLMEN